MHRLKSASHVIVSLAGLLCLQEAGGAELLVNGNLETFTNGLPNSWTYVQGDGFATVERQSPGNPFTNVYATSAAFIGIVDGFSTGPTPRLFQSFTPQTGILVISVEFQPRQSVGDPMQFAPLSSDGNPLALLRFPSQSNTAINLVDSSGSRSFTTLNAQAGRWFQATMTVDLNSGTYSGSIQQDGGPSESWSNRSLFPGSNVASISIADSGTSATDSSLVYFDNISVRTVPEPSAVGLLPGLGLPMLVRRRR